jgi:hypothetical protein
MDGVFINLTSEDIELCIENKVVIIPANPDLVTPIKDLIFTNVVVNGILSTPLKESDIHVLRGSNWINTIYNQITTREDNIQLNVSAISPYIKYPFTKEQIAKIDKISNGRTRLLILSKEDVEYWSDGKFECPFRNYRLFICSNKSLLEYPIPKTYLDIVVEGVKSFSDKLK